MDVSIGEVARLTGLPVKTIRYYSDIGLPQYRRELARQLAKFSDHWVERYWQLIGLINRWPAQPSLMRPYEWFMAALDASL